MGRLKKLGIIIAVIGVLVVLSKRLMGGLGPQPGTDMAPKAWPSLVPEPAAGSAAPSTAGANGNGSAAAPDVADPGSGETTEADATSD